MVTVKDVARRAQVSPGTVSNALTGKRPVSAAAQARIKQAIEELGYQPNVVARSLVNRRSDTLAVVASQLEYYGPARTVAGIEEEANRLGYSLLLHLLHSPGSQEVSSVLSALTARRVDGIVWAVPEIGDNRDWIKREHLDRLPPVVFLSMDARPGVTRVAIDNRQGGLLAAQHLIAQGYRRIGCIAGPLTWWEARERYCGFREGLESAGVSWSDDWLVAGDWSAASGEVALQHLLMVNSDLDAVFVCNDQMALGALRAVHRMGRRVPGDLALVGFDNIPESAFFLPSLTTVFQNLAEVGRTAVRILHGLIGATQGRETWIDPKVTSLAPELIVRESSLSQR